MRARMLISAVVMLLAAGTAAGQSPGAKKKPGDVKLTPEELSRRIRELGPQLPKIFTSPTPAQEAKAVEACKLYRAADKRQAELDVGARLNLCLLGIRAGCAAGEPKVMLSAARQYWQSLSEEKRSEYAAYVLAWAGIFAGDARAATEALNHLIAHPPSPNRAAWAKSMLPIAAGCAKPVGFSFRLLDGTVVKLSKTRGKAVVMVFWASWSEASISEMPELKKFHQQRQADKNFYLVGFSLDRSTDEARQAIEQYKMTWAQAMDRGMRGLFPRRGVPHAVVVSPVGQVLWQGHPGEKATLAWTADFARRQAARISERKKPPRPKPIPPTAPAAKRPKPDPSGRAASIADQKYKLARTYLKLRLRSKCLATLREIVEKYPDTPAAEKARALLKEFR